MFNRRTLLSICSLLMIAAPVMAVGSAKPSLAAGTAINVTLWDKGAETPMATDLGFPAPGKDMSKATMGINLSDDYVHPGEITFEVVNSSKDAIHELIIARLKDLTQIFPYNSNEERVEEEKIMDLGEVSELDPGATGALRINLQPGSYLLFCNIPGHFKAGMWTVLTVTTEGK